MILGFLLPGAMNLPRSVPFHNDLDKLLGEWSSVGEPLLWLISVLSGIIFCELVGDISRTFSPVFFPRHSNLSKKEKVEWINRLRTHYITIQPARMYPSAAFLSVCGCVLHHNSGNRYR
jgi:hypothetical protein